MNSSFKILETGTHSRKSPYTNSLCIITKDHPPGNTQLKIFNLEGLPLLTHSVDRQIVENIIFPYYQLINVNMLLFRTREYTFLISGIFNNPIEKIMNPLMQSTENNLQQNKAQLLVTPTDLKAIATDEISVLMNSVLADMFALYLKTKNFHWHMSGSHFRDYHLLLDGQAAQLFAMIDPAAERIRKLGGTTLRSIGHISRTQRIIDNDAEFVDPLEMLAELRDDNKMMAKHFREAHACCNAHHDIASASLIETWIDETEERIWFLFEATRTGDLQYSD